MRDRAIVVGREQAGRRESLSVSAKLFQWARELDRGVFAVRDLRRPGDDRVDCRIARRLRSKMPSGSNR